MSEVLSAPSPRARAVETVLTGARLVLPDRVAAGTLVIRDGRIAEIDTAPSRAASAIDLDGDYLMPGIVDLHTDNLERQIEPRPGARWPSRDAMLAHDAQCAAAGITTVFDALCVGDLGLDNGDRCRTMTEGCADLTALHATRLLRVSHFVHLRCELPAPGMAELLAGVVHHALVRMASLMDHTPGVGQYADLERYRSRRLRSGMTEAELGSHIGRLVAQRAAWRQPNRRAVLDAFRDRAVVLASHDDETVDEVTANHADGIRISEFPVRLAAARAAKALGMHVVAGSPNLVRGGSHSGNVAAADLLDAGVLDALASDYVPPSLLGAAFLLAERGVALPEAVALVTSHPATLAGLDDRGRLAIGLRADLTAVRCETSLATPCGVWHAGRRVA